ncbi:nitroreductase family protein [Photobacterium damselae]|uniref:nitroreductase family protein n=1 Tax=Photobacterium damselae TaxID=38293 RepID=UPI0015933B58|nr:nitroreductase family protein [Photobacterium damselae]NVH48265.1 nitroreductase family protein [Photobacterium damselae subsp. damselae]
MKSKIIIVLEKILPKKLFIILKMRPRLMFVDVYTATKIKWLWSNMLDGIDYRGDESAVLRKSTHILEKGLQRTDKKNGHSTKIVEKTLNLLDKADEENIRNWSKGIIQSYNNFQKGINIDEAIDLPLFDKTIDTDSLVDLIKSRRSHRYFKDDKVSPDIIKELAKILMWAPNSCNRQTTKIYITTNRDKIKKCLSLNGGATCMNIPPVFISFVSDTRSYILPVEREAAFIDVSLAAQNFVLLAHNYNLGTCILNWTHASTNEERELRKELKINDHELIIFNMILGYPLKNIHPSEKKPLSKIVEFRN